MRFPTTQLAIVVASVAGLATLAPGVLRNLFGVLERPAAEADGRPQGPRPFKRFKLRHAGAQTGQVRARYQLMHDDGSGNVTQLWPTPPATWQETNLVSQGEEDEPGVSPALPPWGAVDPVDVTHVNYQMRYADALDWSQTRSLSFVIGNVNSQLFIVQVAFEFFTPAAVGPPIVIETHRVQNSVLAYDELSGSVTLKHGFELSNTNIPR